MLRKTIVTMASIVALTGTAYAWDVNVSVTPANSANITGGTIGRNSFSSEIAEKAFTVTAKTGYDLNKVVVDGVVKSTDIVNKTSYSTTFTSEKSHKLSAVLAIKTFNIKAVNPTTEGGVASAVFSPINALKAKYGTSRVISVIPKKGFEISAVTDNGTPVTVYRDRAATTPVTAAELAANPANSPVYVVLSSLAADHALAATMQVAQPVQARISPNTTQTKDWSYFRIENPDRKLVFSAAKSAATAGIASYAWTLEPASAGTLSTPNAKTVAFTAKGGGDSTLTLTVTDVNGVTDTASVKISITGDIRTSECIFCHGIRAKDKPLMAQFTSSVHAKGENPLACTACHNHHATEPSDLTKAKAACATCHSESLQGTQLAKSTHVTGEVAQAYYGGGLTCSSCHNPHSTVATFGAGTANGCQKCHAPGHTYSIYSSNLVAKAPHGGGTSLVKAQYLSASSNCAECHSNHDNNYNIEYAESGHGNVTGEAWWHYDWLSASRLTCARCHTTTGFINNLNGVTTTATPGLPGQVLACNGCHTDTATGALRTAGAYTLTASNGATAVYPDAAQSNLCLRCHGARETGDSIKLDPDTDGVRSFINSHYLAAAGTVYNKGGYEFAGQNYASLGYHKNVGSADAFTTGTKGACVACHMTGGKTGHNWEVVKKDGSTITEIASTTCVKCHGNLTPAALVASKESYEVGLNALKDALAAKGIYFYPASPYFYTATYVPGGTNTAFTDWASVYGLSKWKDTMGAAFNFNMLEHEPGAYAHNHAYAMKLIVDSIDFIADGAVDGNGVPAEVIAAAASKEFAEQTSHTALAVANPSKANCSVCHAPGAHYGGAPTNGTATGGTSKTQWVTQGLVCADCHGSNSAPNRDWAEGGHGEVSNEDDNAFVHYDWKARTNDGTRSNSNCDRCHTAYGFIKFANQTTGMTRLRLVSGQPNAVLACVGCHKDINTGALRTDANPAGMTAPLSEGYKALFVQTGTPAVPNAEIQFPSFKNSNICIPCHSGRTTEKIVKDTFALRNWTTATTGFYQHAANMGQTFIGTGAFEFVPGNFSSLPKHHNSVGMGDTTDNGPCATCHNPHSLKVANFTGCAVQYCHGTGFGEADVNRAKANYEAAVKVLENLVTTKIGPLFVVPGTPINTERAAVRWAAGTGDPAVAVKNYGAWYNWHILTNADKAAFAHNPAYARQILVDTIDYLDDGLNNGSYSNAIYSSSALTAGEKTQAAAIVTAQGCNGCHNATITSTPHNQGAANGTLAAYVSSRSLCTDCHAKSQYHYTSSQQNKDFAASGHGDVTKEPWFGGSGHDWKNSATCNACHSATGFRKFVASNYTDATAWGAGDTSANEVASCKACHTSSADFKGSVVSVTGYQAGMGGFGSAAVSKTDFADVGKSGVCIPCHAGREDGKTIKALETAGNPFTNVSFKNPHYLAAAGVFYGKAGFQFYTSGVRYNTYGAAGKIGRTANWSHGKIGMDNFTAAKLRFDSVTTSKNNVGIVRGTGNNGQCVGCHVGPNATHTFDAFKTMEATWGDNATGAKGCYGCHNSEDMKEVAEDELLLFNRGMDFFKFTLAQNNIFYTDAYPYFNNAGGTALKNWTLSASPAVGPIGGTGAQNMGAAMNFKLLSAEKGAHVHNRAFSRALIADSIVYLQTGNVGNRSVSSTNPNAIMNFTNYSTALAATPDGNPKSISNLKGWILRLSSGKYTRR